MSTQNRSGGGGGGRNKVSKANTQGQQNKELQKEAGVTLAAGNVGDTNTTATNVSGSQKGKTAANDHVKEQKEKPQMKQPTAEQIRIAQITDIKGGIEDPKIREKVEKLMEMTQRSEEDVCCALYECDNDLDRAVMFLFEQLPVNAFATTSKKKKNRQANNADSNAGEGDWNNENAAPNSGSKDDRDKGRRGGPGGQSGRGGRDGGRGRDGGLRRDNNNRNGTSNFKVDTFRSDGGGDRGRPSGNRREGSSTFGSRGGRGGRSDNRDRDSNRGNYRGDRPRRNQEENMQQIDSWEPSQGVTADSQKQEVQIDTWGDWDNEEYTGSLTDTKVFTPSTSTTSQQQSGQQQSQQSADQLSAPPGLNPPTQQIDSYSSAITSGQVQQQTTASVVAGGNVANQTQYPEIHSGTTAAQHLRQALEMPQIQSSTLSAEQSQYFNTLSSQNSNVVNSYQTGGVQYQPSYGATTQYGTTVDPVTLGQVAGQQGQRRPPARARVPPPSKIPSTAVEMPGDALNNIGYLDVQFGGLDFSTEDSFENVTDKFGAATLDASQTAGINAADDYQNKSAQKSALAGTPLQNLSTNDNLASQSDNLSSYTQRSASNVPSSVTSGGVSNNYGQLGKSTDPYGNQTNTNVSATGYQTNSYSSQTKTPSYQAAQGYSTGYSSSAQVSSNNNFPPASNTTYNSYNQSYQQQPSTTGVGSNVVASANNNTSQSIPVNSSSVNNNSANTNTGYLSSQYPVNVPSSTTYPSQQNAYQTSNQSVYGNTGLSNSAGYSSSTNTTSGQYNNFSTSSKLKDSTISTAFDSTSSTSASSGTVTSSVSTSNMSSPSLGLSNTKVTNSTAKSGTTVVPNIPMVSQYIQTPGMPYYQPQVYSYEDMQLMQQRVSHMPGYYENFIQAPTSLTGAGAAGVRDANLSSLTYSPMSDARFARTDNNSSPVSNVPSTMSQQTGSGGHMVNVPFAYYYPGNNAMMPGGYQFSTPIYQQVATPNATSGGQFPKPSYNSGYGSTSYDTLNQTTQDYNKTPYGSSGVGQQSKGQTVSNPQTGGTGSDITSSMYGKSHAALNKVNSYEKQSFHSATPPPFNLVGSQTALNNVNAASAQAYGSQHLYIPAIAAQHHNMNMHQPHQMDGLGRVYYNSNDIYSANTFMQWDSTSTGQRQQSNSQGKSATKQGYSPSYWNAQN